VVCALQAQTANRALSAFHSQERHSHGFSARPSQVIDSESVSPQQLQTEFRPQSHSRYADELGYTQHQSIQALIGANSAHRNGLILQAETGPSMHRDERFGISGFGVVRTVLPRPKAALRIAQPSRCPTLIGNVGWLQQRLG
jgi:hypothetical protein